MVFYVRSRRAYDELLQLLGHAPSPLWVERDVLNSEEISHLRDAGREVTNFTTDPDLEPDLSTIRLHHPDQIIWIES